MKNLTEEYVKIDWSGICSDFDLEHGDISPEQSFEIDRALGNINEIIHAFIDQNKTKTMDYNVSLTRREHNVLMVALDHMYEHLDDMRGDLDDYEDEVTNIKRIAGVKALQKLFKQ
jgi:DhnA family fructose-bisphosphate aldolase class Ia